MYPLDILGGPSIPHTLHVFSSAYDDVSDEVREGGSGGGIDDYNW